MKLSFRTTVQRKNGFKLHAEEECECSALGIVGPSGSGKSTLLDCLAGIERGTVFLNGKDYSDLPLEKREIGYLTQEPLLFMHMSVQKNLTYSPRCQGLDSIVDALGLRHLLSRMPPNLSGGERRRVALARAILSRPKILLLDEPFAGLDEELRRDAMSLLHNIKTSSGIPLVLVSHHADELLGLTDRTIRLCAGEVIARGPTETLLLPGETKIDNYFTGTVTGPGLVAAGNTELSVILPESSVGRVRLACYARDILIANTLPDKISARNVFKARIVSAAPAGGVTLLAIDEPSLRVIVTNEASHSLDLHAGAEVYAIIKASSIAYLGPG